LRSNGPDGSRLLALLRLDRLRASPDASNTIAALDRLLLLLPDRHRLIDGTGLDLYRDFDTLLIATPNPRDAAVTFLAARHHLMDAALRAALDRGAKTAKNPITWRTVEGRPVGIRQPERGPANQGLDRDDRILVLPMPALALMATPPYATLLLGRDLLAPTTSTGAVDAGSPDAQPGGGERRKPAGRPNWREIAARIEAEESAVPDNAAFLMTMTGLFGTPAVDSEVGPPPQSLTVVAGAEAPFIEILAEFKTAAEADRWEQDVPAWKRKLVTNPVVILSGFSSLIGRAENTREGNTLHLRLELSTAELQRLLNLAGNLAQTALAHPR